MIILLGLVILAGLWRWSPLRGWLGLDAAGLAGRLRENIWAPAIVLGIFIAGSFAAFPITVLIGITGLIFDHWHGMAYSAAGSFAGAAAGYGLGYALGRERVRRLAGDRVNRVSRYLASRGIVTIAIARNLPIAPFTIVNVAAGASHISFRDFMTGTVAGMSPGIIAITIFSGRLKDFFEDPSWWMLAALAALAAAMVSGVWLLDRRLGRKPGTERGEA